MSVIMFSTPCDAANIADSGQEVLLRNVHWFGRPRWTSKIRAAEEPPFDRPPGPGALP
jgi:hypothetical protein